MPNANTRHSNKQYTLQGDIQMTYMNPIGKTLSHTTLSFFGRGMSNIQTKQKSPRMSGKILRDHHHQRPFDACCSMVRRTWSASHQVRSAQVAATGCWKKRPSFSHGFSGGQQGLEKQQPLHGIWPPEPQRISERDVFFSPRWHNFSVNSFGDRRDAILGRLI